MTHTMVVFLGALGAMLFALFFQPDPSAAKCAVFAIFGAILGFALYHVGSKIKHKVTKNQ
jgi:multisubunit Na+/H+ antiporter MnhG subunit